MAPLNILIVGGGIAGPTLAHWLAKQSHTITILERAPNLRVAGQQIDLRGEGLIAMRRMGLEPRVREKIVDEQGLRFINEQGREQALFESNKTGKGKQSFSAEFEIMRGDLVRILYEETKDACEYKFGVTVEDFEHRGDGVWCRLSDGSEGVWDLLVGADGQSSRTRRKLFGEEAGEAAFDFKNLYLSYFTVPKKETDDNFANVLILPGNRALFTRVDNPRTMQVYLALYTPNGEYKPLDEAMKSGNMDKVKGTWAELYKGVGWEAPRIIDALLHSDEAKDFYNQKIGQVKMKGSHWSKGRVVLLGDAGYCPSPISGFGTSLSMAGAYVLAGEIARALKQNEGDGNGDVGKALDAALAGYEKSLRPLVESAQKLPPGLPGLLYAESSWGVWWRNFLLRVLCTLRVHKLAERLFSDEIGGKWKMPEYPELNYATNGSV